MPSFFWDAILFAEMETFLLRWNPFLVQPAVEFLSQSVQKGFRGEVVACV